MSKVLIIEDDVLVSRMYQKVFKFEGFEVVVANNGQQGVEMAKAEHPNLIFCDVMMPKMNGLEVLDALKLDPDIKNTPVVMLTNLSGTQDAQTAMSKGALMYMVKSEFKPKDVAARAKEILAGKATPSTPAASASATTG